MSWTLNSNRPPHAGWLWVAIGLGLIVAGIQFMHHRPHRAVSARPPADGTPPVTNASPVSPLSPEEAARAADTLSALFSGPPSDGSRDIWDLIQLLQQPDASLDDRRNAARQLAQRDDPLALAFLSEAALAGSPRLRAMVAEALGSSTIPTARELLLRLLNDPDPTVARGAVRGLAESPAAGTATVLGEILNETRRPESVRSEAALALGGMEDPSASAALAKALGSATEESMQAGIWEALGLRPVQETAEFIRDYLKASDTSAHQRVMALESLGDSPHDVSPLLVAGLRDPDPEVREAAAWALGSNEQPGSAASWVLEALSAETDPGVRLRLYHALENQQAVDPRSLLPMLEREQTPEVRLAGLEALAVTLQQGGSQETSLWFDTRAVPMLREEALRHPNLLHRMNAVTALARVGSPAATDALQAITRLSDDPRLARAAEVR